MKFLDDRKKAFRIIEYEFSFAISQERIHALVKAAQKSTYIEKISLANTAIGDQEAQVLEIRISLLFFYSNHDL